MPRTLKDNLTFQDPYDLYKPISHIGTIPNIPNARNYQNIPAHLRLYNDHFFDVTCAPGAIQRCSWRRKGYTVLIRCRVSDILGPISLDTNPNTGSLAAMALGMYVRY